MFGRVLRTWRRLIIGMGLLGVYLALSAATGILEPGVVDMPAEGPAETAIFAIAIVLTLFIVVGIPVAILAIVIPGLLNVVELMLLTLISLIPFVLFRQSAGLPTIVDCVAIFVLYISLYKLLYGDWLDNLGRRDSRPHRARFVVPDAPAAVWARIVPLPENAATFYWPQAEFMAAPEGSNADFVLHAPRRKGLAPAVDAYRIEEIDPGHSVTFRTEPLPGNHGVKERHRIVLTPLGTRTRVEIEVTFLDISVAERIRLWIGNDAHEFAASLKNRARGRRDRSIHGMQVLPA